MMNFVQVTIKNVNSKKQCVKMKDVKKNLIEKMKRSIMKSAFTKKKYANIVEKPYTYKNKNFIILFV